MVTGFILSKVIASFAGPRGIALVGQLSNISSISNLAGSGGIASGVIKYTAENASDEAKSRKVIATASWLMIGCSLTTAIILACFSKWLAVKLFGDGSLYIVLLALVASIPFSSIGTLIISVINGKKDIKRYVKISIFANLASFTISIPLVFFFRVKGALIASAINTIPVFLFAAILSRKDSWLHDAIARPRMDRESLRRLLSYTAMTAASALVVPLGQILVRNYLIHRYSIEWAGYWQALIKLSDYYLVFVTSSLGVYYIPRLSELSDQESIRSEIIAAARIVLPLLATGQLVLYTLRVPILSLLYTKEFACIAVYMPIQLAGDFLKLCGWLVSCLMVAKAKIKLFISTEIFFGLSYVVLVAFLSRLMGFQGVLFAYAIEYAAYLLAMLAFLSSFLRKPSHEAE